MKLHRINGFSLIELLVAVAIVGILAAIAVPSYQSHIIKASRAAAQTELLELASLQEKIYLNSSAYTANVNTAYNGTSAGGLGHANNNGALSLLTKDGKYTLCITDAATVATVACTPPTTTQTYVIRATPVAGTTQAGNGCLTIRENSLRQWHENNDACNTAAPTSW